MLRFLRVPRVDPVLDVDTALAADAVLVVDTALATELLESVESVEDAVSLFELF